jgi:membrane-associated phospholipid phosphatase
VVEGDGLENRYPGRLGSGVRIPPSPFLSKDALPQVPRGTPEAVFHRRILVGLIILGVLWAALAVVFAFTDLEISEALYNPHSSTALFFQKYGGYPGPALIILALLIYAANLPRSSRAKLMMMSGSALLGATAASYYIVAGVTGFWSGLAGLTLRTTVPVGAGLLVFWIVVLAVLRRRAAEFTRRYAVFSKVVIRITLVVALAVVQVMKAFWGRASYRNLGPDQAGYSPWYFPQGFNEDRSFPSGHVVMAWMLLAVIILARYAPRAVRAAAWVVPFVWGTVVAVERIIAGAHYASDVLFGTGFTLLAFLLLYRRYGPPPAPGTGSRAPSGG